MRVRKEKCIIITTTNETASAEWTAAEENEIISIMARERVGRMSAIRLMRTTPAARLATLTAKRDSMGFLGGIDALDYIRLRRKVAR